MLVQLLLLLIALLLLIPSLTLWVECFTALLPQRADRSGAQRSPRKAILVPAHDEAATIQPILGRLLEQLQPDDRLLVIADNCTDATADVARSTGATVIERQDQARRGKGFALDYGLKFLAADPPDVVIVVDADCVVQPGTLDQIAETALAHNRPAQALYLMEQPAQPNPKDAVSALAFLVKNRVRPQGYFNLGLPALLTGTGMAFPWAVIRQVSLASGNIVEDMQLSMDLAIAGYPTQFCPDTKVLGLLPQQEQAAKSQRTRWEHGHLQTMRSQIPPLLKAAIQQKRFDLLAIALDLSIPPLSLLVMLWLGVALVAGVFGIFTQAWLPVMVISIEGGLILSAVLAAWLKFGRTELPLKTVLAIPLYILWKIPLYFAFLVKPQTQWIRTERDIVDGSKS
jgi:cellulose synthase/poly-beta-1,6-N-acetylglucosamine synthase-like glycosyltransferase